MKGKDQLWKLFTSTLFLSAFTFGGGYVIITLMKKKFVDELHWIDEDEMLDLVAIAQSAPGAIAVNGAIVIGYKLAGMIGMFITVIATILPPFIIISFISVCYSTLKDNIIIALLLEGMQVGVAVVIVNVVLGMGKDVIEKKERLGIIIMIIAFILAYFFHVNVIFIILACIALGIVKSAYHLRRHL